jgi:hypothetical protein
MKRLVWLLAALFLLPLGTPAQERPAAPEWEFAGMYSHLFGNVGSSTFHLNGGGVSLDENVNDWLGGRAEVNAYQGAPAGVHLTAETYMFGPVASYRRSSRFTPYAQFELGLIHANTGYLGISQDANKFALAPGVGVDFRVHRQAAFRLQASYLSTYFLNSRQDNLQFSAGLVLYFGRK